MMENNLAPALDLSTSLTSERLIINHSSPVAPNNGNPDFPHPILGDLKVRQAIDCAIDRKAIVDKLLFGKAKAGASEIAHGWGVNLDLKLVAHDPEKAKKLLEEAGWKAGPDGIRQKDGMRLRLKITTTTGNKLREMVQQVLVDQMKKLGIEFYIENVPSSVLFGSWANDADRKKGRYDIMMYTTGPGIDPHQQFEGYFHSKNIPTEANGGSGYNYTRHRDADGRQMDRRRRQVHQHGRPGQCLPHGPEAALRDRAAHRSLSAADRPRLPQPRQRLCLQRQRHHRRRGDLERGRLGGISRSKRSCAHGTGRRSRLLGAASRPSHG